MSRAVIPEVDILYKHGAEIIQQEQLLERGISYKGWTFRSFSLLFFLSSKIERHFLSF